MAITKLEETLCVVQPPLSLQQHQQQITEPKLAKSPDQPVRNTASQVPLADRKLNIVVYGLPENPPNMNREDRLQRDVENLLSVIRTYCPLINQLMLML